MKSAVVVFPASNCDRDAAVVLEQMTGKKPHMVWHADSEIPDVDRVTACMVQKRAQLSDGCKAVFQYVPPVATPVNYAPAAKPAKPLNLNPYKRG